MDDSGGFLAMFMHKSVQGRVIELGFKGLLEVDGYFQGSNLLLKRLCLWIMIGDIQICGFLICGCNRVTHYILDAFNHEVSISTQTNPRILLYFCSNK